jgi:signal transduction histidine kinase/CheY-like chemotaxis protein
MLEFIEVLTTSLKNGDSDFYVRIVKGYVSLTGSDYGLLLSSDGSGNPILLSSTGFLNSRTSELTKHYLKNYNLLFRSLSDNENDALSFTCRTEASSLLLFFRRNFRGILVLVSDTGTFNQDISGQINALAGITLKLIESFHEKRDAEILFNKKDEECMRKSSYFSRLTNDLRTPMNAISGFAQLLKEPDLKQDNLQKYINIISETSEIVISRISYFNEIAEIETGQVKIFSNVVNIPELIDEACSKHYLKFKEKSVILDKKVLTGNDFSYSIIDEAKLKQVLDTLISNALEYTFTGKVMVCCTFKNSFFEFVVSDTGVGIDPDTQSGLFDFQSGQQLFMKNSKGSGLGLIIARAYVEMMGGKIWCESKVGKGTDFIFKIPFYAVPENYYKVPRDHKTRSSDTLKKRILVAEDDNLNFYLISNFLSRLNVDIIRAENGSQAVDIFKSENIDIILMDIRMPVMDGYTATKIIREINTDVKIIAQTAYSNDKSIAVSNGCNDFIAKPFSRNQLVSLVSSYL